MKNVAAVGLAGLFLYKAIIDRVFETVLVLPDCFAYMRTKGVEPSGVPGVCSYDSSIGICNIFYLFFTLPLECQPFFSIRLIS